MASKISTPSLALCLTLNLLFSTFVTTNGTPCSPPPTLLKPTPTPSPLKKTTCPKDTLKFGVCVDLLGKLVNLVVGSTHNAKSTPCCNFIAGLADIEAASCLCTAIKAHVLGINLDVPLSLTLLLNHCGNNVPSGFQCA